MINTDKQPIYASSEAVTLYNGVGVSFTFTSAALSGTLGAQIHDYTGHVSERVPLQAFISNATYAAANTFQGTVSGTPALGTILTTQGAQSIAALSTTGGAFSVVLQGTGGEPVVMGLKLGDKYFTSSAYTIPAS